MKDLESFSIEIPVGDMEKMKEFQEVMDQVHDTMCASARKIADELNVSEICSLDILYLRSRSRWSQELEEELIRLHQEGNPPNLCEFGN